MAVRYWVGGAGTWDNTSTANWSTTSGGASGASAPTAADDPTFDANSGVGSFTVTVASTAVCRNATINNTNATIQLTSNLSSFNSLVLTAGVFDLAGYTFTVNVFNSNNANVRTLAFGSAGAIVSPSNSASVWDCSNATNLTVTGAKNVRLTYAGSTGTRTIRHGSTGGSLTTAVNMAITAGTDTVNDSAVRFLTYDFTGFSGTMAAVGRRAYTAVILSPTMTFTATTNAFNLDNGGAVSYFTSNGITMDFPVTVLGDWELVDNFSIGTTRAFTLTSGSFNAAGKNVSIGSFALSTGVTKTLTIGSATWTVAAGWNAETNKSGFTVTPSTGTISMTSASTKTFAGGGFTWPTLSQGGSGALTIQQSNTFTNITNTVQPATITLTSGTTQTVTDFDVSGTSGNLITLNASTPGSQATLTDSGGINSVSFVDIKDIAATGYGEWQAYTANGNVDSGNNVGWVFTAPPSFVASEFFPELRSFTEKRRF